uniref:Uncharacterized protein n=1 Tax=Parascaris univalens TaxID=6257 RepID=A0A915BC70_PARUN
MGKFFLRGYEFQVGSVRRPHLLNQKKTCKSKCSRSSKAFSTKYTKCHSWSSSYKGGECCFPECPHIL